MDLRHKRVLVTGGTRGIGAAVATSFSQHGADLVINGRNLDDDARSILGQVESVGRNAKFLAADMSDSEQIRSLVDQSVEALGGLDLLVHNAGGPATGRIDEISTAEWMYAFDVHVHAAFHLCQRALPHLRKNSEGAILLVSSAAGIRGCPGAVAYGTVKGAIVQFTRMMARDLADDNIRVNCVAPGIIRTRFHKNMTSEQQAHNVANRIPLHREGTPEQVADVVRLLATNDFITGENVVIDGGMTMQIVR